MANSVTDVQTWAPLHVTPVTGGIKLAGDAVSGVVTGLDGIVQIASGLVKAAAVLAPGIADPAIIALNGAISTAQKLLKDLAVLEGQYSLLLVPPVVGTGAAFVEYINTKIADTSDPFRPADATNKEVAHAGILVFGKVHTPSLALDSFKAFQALFGVNSRKPSNASGFNTFRPVVKVVAESGNPILSWAYPATIDLLRRTLSVRGANGVTYSTIKAVREVVIWRRQKSGQNVIEEKIDTLPFNALVTTYVDRTVTEGTYEYAIEFDYELSNGEFFDGVKSNWSKINLTRKLKKKATGGGNYPKFIGVQAKYTIEGFDVALSRTNQFLEQFKAGDVNFQKELNGFADFISTYSTQLTQRITTLIGHLKRVAGNLDVLAQNGLSFVAYQGHPVSCLQEISSKLSGGSATGIYVGMFMNASSESQVLADLSIDGIKRLCGWGGELRIVDTIGQQARNILKAGATILENVEQAGKTTVDSVESSLTTLEQARQSLVNISGKGKALGTPSDT